MNSQQKKKSIKMAYVKTIGRYTFISKMIPIQFRHHLEEWSDWQWLQLPVLKRDIGFLKFPKAPMIFTQNQLGIVFWTVWIGNFFLFAMAAFLFVNSRTKAELFPRLPGLVSKQLKNFYAQESVVSQNVHFPLKSALCLKHCRKSQNILR